MLSHAKFINAPNTLVIITPDTIILVITLCNMPKLFQRLKAWLEVGLTSINTLRYINVNKVLDTDFAVLREWDFTASFSRKGKVNPLKKLRKNAMATKVFSKLGEKETVNNKRH